MGIQKSRNHQEPQPWTLVNRIVFSVSTTVAALSFLAFITLLPSPSAHAASAKLFLPSAPAQPRVGLVYYNTTDNREYIFNGQEWVPHDASIDTYVLQGDKKSNALPAPSIGSGGSSPTATPSSDQGVTQ